jgi:CHAT domain-containing protein/Tfp pilus assembly protein PilF
MDPDVAISLGRLANVLQGQGKYHEAELLYERALDLLESDRGRIHPDVATTLNNLAVVLQAQGEYDKAQSLYNRALGIRQKIPDTLRFNVANNLNNLATLYDAQGRYAESEALYLRALSIHQKEIVISRGVMTNANSPPAGYQAQDGYIDLLSLRDAEQELPHALFPELTIRSGSAVSHRWIQPVRMLLYVAGDIQSESLPIRPTVAQRQALHLDLATNLTNLASHYETRGEYARAEPLLIRAHDISAVTLDDTQPDVATSLDNLGRLYEAQGAYAKAESFLARALAIRERALGTMHPDVAISLDSLASLRWAQRRYAEAELLCARALAIRETTLGARHPDVAHSLNNLALIHWARGKDLNAESTWIRAVDIWENAVGTMHPDLARGLNNLGALYNSQGNHVKAEPLWLRALDIRETALGATHPDVAQSLDNLAMLYQALALHRIAEIMLTRAAAIREGQLHVELGRLSEPRKRLMMTRLRRETDQIVSLHADALPTSPSALELALTTVLRRKGRVLDSLVENHASLRANPTTAVLTRLEQLAAARAELSTHLRAPFYPQIARRRAQAISDLRTRIEQLESQLHQVSLAFREQPEPPTIKMVQSALPPGAALVEFVRYRHFDAQQSNSWQEERYVAYILSWRGPPRAVVLGAAKPVEAAVERALTAMRKSTNVAKTALKDLDRLVFASLREHLTNVSHVILSPDAELNLVPFEALVDPQGKYEIESRLISYVTSGRELLRFGQRRRSRSGVTIVAAPDYGAPQPPARNGLGTFRPLEGAAAEAGELSAYFARARTLTGRRATKSALAAAVGPSVLHIATHGFYARDLTTAHRSSTTSSSVVSVVEALPVPSVGSDLRGLEVEYNTFSSLLLQHESSEDPTEALDRAGLAMAGANVSSDGILSARELASYDWWGTQLVVLSACETGIGTAPSGDGVYGMRRALALAGTESQVVSLWKVSDSSTRELMLAFYFELSRAEGHAQALRQAKLQLLRRPRFAHPYHWAAFVPAGDWTPFVPGASKS